MAGERMLGTVETMHRMEGRFGGSYGVILGDDGERYVWDARCVYRDGSRMAIGARVSFTVVDHGYARAVSTRDVK